LPKTAANSAGVYVTFSILGPKYIVHARPTIVDARNRPILIDGMKEPTLAILKRLFAKSHNQCAFPKCELPIAEDSGTITGIVCHIKARSKGGPRFDAKQSDEERHLFANLVLMCARHSKIIDTDPKLYSVELLQEMKLIHEREGWIELASKHRSTPEHLLENYRLVYIEAHRDVIIHKPKTVVFKNKRQPKIIPEGVIAGNSDKRGYIMYLVKRYHEFARHDRPNYKYTVLHGLILRDFGKKIDHISIDRFPRLAEYLQGLIDNDTRAGNRNKREGIRSYRSFEEYQADCLAAPRPKKSRKRKPPSDSQ
jgi:hypothetical protein